MTFKQEPFIKGVIKSFGLVFGDIGTSPIYTFTVVFLLTPPTESNILGVLSLIFWTLIIIVTVEYAWLAMSLSKKGEGGTIVLRELLIPLLTSRRQVAFVTFLSFIGISLLVGDGVITPAISILSAVEGSTLIPGLSTLKQETLIVVASAIALTLFSFQKKGTDKVSGAFGPMMTVWFLSLAASGVVAVMEAPHVIGALSPHYALRFFIDHRFTGILVLSQVILCATGGEALYADMGHLGRKPILRAWGFVFVALALNYLGQGAYLIKHPETKNILFEMVFNEASFLYIPFLVLSILATVIASQAMISGLFSIVFQGITTHILPLFKVDYTSTELRSQIYIGFVNWFLLIAVLFIMIEFGESSKLAAAYGLAVNGDMILTGGLMTWIFYLKNKRGKSALAFMITVIVCIFMVSNVFKIPHGGYWSLVIGAIPFGMILLYTGGQKNLYRALKPVSLQSFLERYTELYKHTGKLTGSALFFARTVESVTPYIVRTILTQGIVYEDNIIVSMVRRDDPFGVIGFFRETIAPGLRTFEIQFGYLEVFDVEEILREAGIDERAIFYGVEDIRTRNFFWKVFSLIKKLTPSYVQFHNLPSDKLHGIITRVEM